MITHVPYVYLSMRMRHAPWFGRESSESCRRVEVCGYKGGIQVVMGEGRNGEFGTEAAVEKSGKLVGVRRICHQQAAHV